MTVTVVARVRAQPGQGSELLGTLVPALEQVPPAARGRQAARLLQGTADPDQLLYVGDWDDRETYWVRVQALGAPLRSPDRAGAIEHQYYDQLALYEDMTRRVDVAVCVALSAPPATAAAVRAFVERQGRRELAGRPGFVVRAVYQDQDVPERLLVMHGWDSSAAVEAFRAETAPGLQARMQSWGVQADVFVGQVRAEVDRYSSPASPPGAPESAI